MANDKPAVNCVETAPPPEAPAVPHHVNETPTDVSESIPRVSASTILAVFFMGLSYAPAIATGFVMPAQIIQQIGLSLGDTENIAWIPGGWSIGSAISFAIAGNLSDVFGRRWVLIFGQGLTLVGGAIGCAAQSTLMVVAASTCIGFGAGVIFVSYPGIAELLPNKYRGIGLAWTEFCINIPWGAISGLLATQLYLHATWRWCYYLTIIYAAICIAGTFICYFPPSRPQHDYERSRWEEFKSLDFVGLTLFAAGLAVFLVGITYLGRSQYSVTLVASTITIGAIVFISSFIYDFTVPKSPIFPLKLFRMSREFTIHLVILFMSGMIWQPMIALGNQATLFMFTSDIVEIGIISIPASMSGVIGGWILPSFVHKIKHVRWQIGFALLLQTAFTASYAAVIPHNKTAWAILPMFGQSCFTWVTLLAYVSTSLFVPQEELGVSAGLIGTFRSAGGSVGNAIFSTILTSNVNRNLANDITSAAIAAGFSPSNLNQLVPAVIENAVGNSKALTQVPGITQSVIDATTTALKYTYARAFQLVFYTTIPFGVTALAAAYFVRDPSHLLNDNVAVEQEKLVLGLRNGKTIKGTATADL